MASDTRHRHPLGIDNPDDLQETHIDFGQNLERERRSLARSMVGTDRNIDIGESVLRSLSEQRMKLDKSYSTLGGIAGTLGVSDGIVEKINTRILQDKYLMICLAIALFVILFLSVYYLRKF